MKKLTTFFQYILFDFELLFYVQNDIIVPKKSEENVDNDDIMITDSLDESTKKKTDLNDENYSVIVNDYNDIQDIDDTFQVNFINSFYIYLVTAQKYFPLRLNSI